MCRNSLSIRLFHQIRKQFSETEYGACGTLEILFFSVVINFLKMVSYCAIVEAVLSFETYQNIPQTYNKTTALLLLKKYPMYWKYRRPPIPFASMFFFTLNNSGLNNFSAGGLVLNYLCNKIYQSCACLGNSANATALNGSVN